MSPADTRDECVVVGTFDGPEDATDVVRELRRLGVPASCIHTDGDVVSVTIAEARLDDAIDAMQRHGAVDVNREEPPEITLREQRDVSEPIPVNRPADEDTGLFREQGFEFPDDDAEPARQTVRAPERQGRSEPHPFAREFERDFRARYAPLGETYDAYDPAYRWGYTLGNQYEWRGRPWEDVAAYARRTWEQRFPDSWERFEAAIRFGWDRLTGPEP
jgi:hypothetical protein